MKKLFFAICVSLTLICLPVLAASVGSVITYQGSLSENGRPTNGTFDLRLALYDAQVDGSQAGLTLTNANVSVTEGLINTTMDFGAEVFDGSAVWLEVGVRPSGSGESFVTLTPRQALLAVPYAVHAQEAETLPDGSVSGEKLATGQVVRSLNGLTDQVELVAGSNIVVNLDGNALMVSATVTKGPPGPEGPQGPQGSIGPAGPQGETGDSLWDLAGTDLNYIGGRIGVGTPSPAAPIHAHGSPVANRGQLSLSSPAGQDAILSLYDADIFTAYLWYDPTAQDLRLQNVGAGDLNLNPYGGNVGIGANNPGAKLHVAGAVAIGNTMDDSPAAGTIRWNGTDFEGYTGTGWASLTGSSADAWSLTGNAGTDAALNFLGTLDDQPLELRVSGYRALRLESTPTSGGLLNVIGGSAENRIYTTTYGGSYTDLVSSDVVGSTIAGGSANSISSEAPSQDDYMTFYSGFANSFSTISGGIDNHVFGSPGSVIAGGGTNRIRSIYDFWLPGSPYVLQSRLCAISGGTENTIQACIGGVIAGGGYNTLHTEQVGLISDGEAGWSTISGGGGNWVTGSGNTIGGGFNNTVGKGITAVGSVIGGGVNNTISSMSPYYPAGSYSVIAGGARNYIYSRDYASVCGGTDNLVEADYGVVLGGLSNVVRGAHALASGRRAMALHDGAFVWGDSTDEDVESSAANELTVRASGGARFFSSADLSTGVTLAAGDGSWASVSDRNAKQDFEPIDGVAVLEKVATLPLSTWSYRAQDSAIWHIGPMAQDFHAAFGLGADDKRITSVDADGVALAAIQGLNKKLMSRESEIAELKSQNADLEKRLAALENLVATMNFTGSAAE